VKQLIVYMGEQRVGELEQDDNGRLRFRYATDWLGLEGAVPISRMLPLTSDAFEGKWARPFFAGLLPEEEPRQKIAAILGISERNDFAMLEQIGGECAGAISLLPEGASPLPVENRLRRLSEEDLQAIVAELPRRPLLAGEEGLRLSLAGAQDKLPVVMDGDTISLPLGNTPSSHIMKPQPARFPGLVANEILCMQLARAVGLTVPKITSRLIGGTACIIVERYDRIRNADGSISRLHQEDFCQALGFPPERKYQQEGGPLLRDCVALLREWSTIPVLDIRDFVDGLIFNVLIGNADAHGKNYSMLYDESRRRLAPFYDLVCTVVWPELSKRLAMNVGKSKNIDEVRPDHFHKMAIEAGLGWPMVRERMKSLCENVLGAIEDHDLERMSVDPPMAGQVASLVSQRAERMLLYLLKQR
jgi:serine/threonine-protein kinase HipA